MIPGKLNKRATFQKRSTLKNEVGHLDDGWLDLPTGTRWVSIEPISAREILAAGQVQGEITHRIRCRYFEGVTTATRIVYKGRIFDIKSALNLREKNSELEILCTEGASNG